jgi:hypothetical protein
LRLAAGFLAAGFLAALAAGFFLDVDLVAMGHHSRKNHAECQ